MEAVVCLDDRADSFLIHRFDTFREQGKLTDLRIETRDGKCVDAHRLVLAARFPLFLKELTAKQDGVTTKWKRFSADIVEAVVDYAYTGRITIAAGNATRLYLLAHNLGSKRIVSWCVDFIRTRISLDSGTEVWSVANATLNGELMELCIPIMAEHFEDVCLQKGLLMQTTAQYFEMLLESNRLKGVSEEVKFRAIRSWLEAGSDGCDVKEKAKVFGKMISRIELTRLSPQCQSEYWTFVRRYAEQFSEADVPPKRVMRPNEIVGGRFRPAFNCGPQKKEVLMIFGYNRALRSQCLTSVPQLQPDESFNAKAPFWGKATALDGRVCIVDCVDSRWSVESVNYRDDSTFHMTFQATQPRVSYAVASRNESVFIFGGYSGETIFSTCEKIDIASGRLTKLPDMLPARCGASALSIPEVGIVVVGGSEFIPRIDLRLRHAEMLVEDAENGSGWRWIKLNPMLQERYHPAVAYFKGCVVVVGGIRGFNAECLPLTSIEQTKAQWTRLNGIRDFNWPFTSLVSFNNRLILLASNFSASKIYEFFPTEENQPLANFEWKPLFELETFSESILLMARETLEER